MARTGSLMRRLAAISRPQLVPLLTTRAHNHSATAGETQVCIVDPLLVLEPERLAAAEAASGEGSTQPFLSLSLPHRLLPALSRGQLELAEGDEPGSHIYFGQRGELFQYSYIGSHAVVSGFTSVILADELKRARAAAAGGRPARKISALDAEGGNWLAFLAHFSAGEPWPAPGLPFLYAGRVVDSDAAGVHVLRQGGTIVGLQVASEY